MKPTERLATATAPDGTVLTLSRHDGAYLIAVNGVELMSTRRTHSEVRLAELACAGLAERAGAAVLVGGLGIGATLTAALALLAPDARVVVAELLPEVIVWNRTAEWGLAAPAMADPRVDVRCADVRDVLRGHPAAFDAIMLDVDNGAESFTTRGNRALYDAKGIRLAMAALRPGGVLAYWSVDSEAAFQRALRGQGLTVTDHRVRAHATSGGYNHVLVATRGT